MTTNNLRNNKMENENPDVRWILTKNEYHTRYLTKQKFFFEKSDETSQYKQYLNHRCTHPVKTREIIKESDKKLELKILIDSVQKIVSLRGV